MWVTALGKSCRDPLKLACFWLSFFLSVLRTELPFWQGAEGMNVAGLGRRVKAQGGRCLVGLVLWRCYKHTGLWLVICRYWNL